MKYQVLSRRYRPQTFDEVIGQQAIVRLLKNALLSKKIPHAFLFTGIRGTGKTTTARIFARALNCEKGVVVEPCNECFACKQLLENRNMDVFEIDGASNTSVNDVRMLKENTRFLPSQSRYKIYIIDEVHMLSTEAFNALLKTLEEPPDYVVFILATTEPEKIPETVLSRCIRLNFRRVEPKEIAQYMARVLKEENIDFEETALFLIARRSEGSVRDSLSFLELVIAYGGGVVTEEYVNQVLGLVSRSKIFELLRLIANKNTKDIINFLNSIKNEGGDLFNFLDNLIFYIRHLVHYSLNIPFDSREFCDEELEELKKIYEFFSKEELVIYYQGLRQILEQIRFSNYSQYDIEIGLLKLILLKDFLENSPTFTARSKETKEYSVTAGIKRLEEVKTEQKGVDDFINWLMNKKPMIASQLKKGNCNFENGVFTVTYSKDNQIFYEHLISEEENKEFLEALMEFFGNEVKLNVNLAAGEEKEVNDSNGGVLKNPAINLLLTEFAGAKLVGVKEKPVIHNETYNSEEEKGDIDE